MGRDILPMAKARGFPPSRVRFPASLEVAARTPSGSFGLIPPPQALAFRKPCGSFSSLLSSSGTWFLFLVKKKERVYISQHGSIFTHRPSRWNPPKRSSVLNVLDQVYQGCLDFH
jgi:hypothetical protein